MYFRPMNPRSNKMPDVKEWIKSLLNIEDEREANWHCRILLEDILNLDPISINSYSVSESEINSLSAAIERINNGEPIQYVTGVSYFYDIQLKVNSSVLIPRPETEGLVDLAIKETSANDKVIDLCSGSGCIAIAYKKNKPNADVYALEWSKEAMDTAQANAVLNMVDIDFYYADLLSIHQLNDGFDTIISNPPYIPYADRAYMEKHVLDFEPEMALFVEDDAPMIFYEAIIDFADTHLNDGGQVMVEIHENLGEQVMQLFLDAGYSDVKIVKDLQGKNRIVWAK